MIILPTARGVMGKAPSILRPQDVFASVAYSGNGTVGRSLPVPINITPVGGGLQIFKDRLVAATNHLTFDNYYDQNSYLYLNTNGPILSSGGIVTVSATQFNLFDNLVNTSGRSYVAQIFKRNPKFMMSHHYTGDGANNRAIPHGLDASVTPGFVLIKHKSTNNWVAWHRSRQATGNYYTFNGTTAETVASTTLFSGSGVAKDPDATNVYLGTNALANTNGQSYSMYVFAHDSNSNGVIHCNVTEASADNPIGWAPQWMMFWGRSTGTAKYILDTERGWGSGSKMALQANATSAEASLSTAGYPQSGGVTSFGATRYAFVAIRADT